MTRRLAARTDGNHTDIIDDLRRVGFHVVSSAAMGRGFPDLVVTGYDARRCMVLSCLVEVKTERGKLTPDQVEFHDEFPEDGPLIVARNAEDVLAWFGRV